jgi:Fe-S cluster assembly protein SufD
MNATPATELAARWADSLRTADYPLAPAWLENLRENATAAFAEAGLPHRKVEAWRYTPLKRLEALAPGLAPVADTAGPADFAPAISDTAVVVDLPGGNLETVRGNLPEGVSVFSMAEALERFEDRVRSLAESVPVDGPARAFAAINTANLHRGAVVHVAEGVDAGSLLLRFAAEGEANDLLSSRVMVLLDAGANLTLVEQHLGTSPAALNLLLQPQLSENARLTHLRVQDRDDEAFLLTATHALQAAGSHYAFCGFELGGGLLRHELNTTLAGEDAHAELAGAWVLDGQRHCDVRVAVDHAAPNCSSEQFFRGVLGGRSRGVFNGRALIREGADGSSVRQSNANLLLSRLAEMDTKPELEIYADEVEASHGATVGQLDETAVFYLRTRGLPEAEARRLLTAAFCQGATSRVDDPALAETIARMIDDAMPEAM